MIDKQIIFSEIICILNFMEREMYEKIPLELIEYLEDNSDIDYKINFDPKKSLEEQEIQEETKIIMALIYINYIAGPVEKKRLLKEMDIGFYIEESEKIGFDIRNFNNRIEQVTKATDEEIENNLRKSKTDLKKY